MNDPMPMQTEHGACYRCGAGARACCIVLARRRANVPALAGAELQPRGRQRAQLPADARCNAVLLTLTAAPEGYVAVLTVLSTAVPIQLPTVLLSQTIKSTMAHAARHDGGCTTRGVMAMIKLIARLLLGYPARGRPRAGWRRWRPIHRGADVPVHRAGDRRDAGARPRPADPGWRRLSPRWTRRRA